MFRTNYSNITLTINIICFAIVIFIIMYRICFFYKLIKSIPMYIRIRFNSTFRAFLTIQMVIRSLPKLSMFGANYTYLSFSIYILYFRIIIFTSMYLFSFLYKIRSIRNLQFYCFNMSTFWAI